MSKMERMKFRVWQQMFSDFDGLFVVAVVIALVFSVLAINREAVFGYMRNAHELDYAEQVKFKLNDDTIQCGVLSEKINSLVLIPEKNEETGNTSRYLLVVNYTLTNTSDEKQSYTMRGKETGKWNGEECHIEPAGYVNLSEDFTTKKKNSGFIDGKETTEECYYAFWIYTEHDEDTYYTIPPLDMEKLFKVEIGLENNQKEKYTTIIGF